MSREIDGQTCGIDLHLFLQSETFLERDVPFSEGASTLNLNIVNPYV